MIRCKQFCLEHERCRWRDPSSVYPILILLYSGAARISFSISSCFYGCSYAKWPAIPIHVSLLSFSLVSDRVTLLLVALLVIYICVCTSEMSIYYFSWAYLSWLAWINNLPIIAWNIWQDGRPAYLLACHLYGRQFIVH